MKKILCSNPNCKGIFAHQLSDRSIEYGRLSQSIVASGNDWLVIGTCGETGKFKCDYKTAVTCTNGKIDTSDLRYEEVTLPVPPVTDPPTPEPVVPPAPAPVA